ncbi:MAG: hypothetical protein WC551_12940 [Patescibacteria group bacterium]
MSGELFDLWMVEAHDRGGLRTRKALDVVEYNRMKFGKGEATPGWYPIGVFIGPNGMNEAFELVREMKHKRRELRAAGQEAVGKSDESDGSDG